MPFVQTTGYNYDPATELLQVVETHPIIDEFHANERNFEGK